MRLPNCNFALETALVGIALAMCTSGCATILEGPMQEVSVQSDPEGAAVKIDGEHVGETPLTVKLAKRNSYEVVIEKPGYVTETHQLTREMVPVWLIVDLIFFPIPFLVDAISGAWYKLDKSTVLARLEKAESADAHDYRIVVEGAERVARPTEGLEGVEAAPFHPAGEQ